MKKREKIVFGKLNLLRNDQLNKKNKIRIGFIGGGPNSFIGYTHRLAARFDNRFEFVAGVFSRDKKISIQHVVTEFTKIHLQSFKKHLLKNKSRHH